VTTRSGAPDEPASPRPLLTIADAAARLQVSTRTLRREIASGRLAVVSIGLGRLLRIRQEALDRYITAQEVQGRPEHPAVRAMVAQAAIDRSKRCTARAAARLPTNRRLSRLRCA